jgi:hypothetical protein
MGCGVMEKRNGNKHVANNLARSSFVRGQDMSLKGRDALKGAELGSTDSLLLKEGGLQLLQLQSTSGCADKTIVAEKVKFLNNYGTKNLTRTQRKH